MLDLDLRKYRLFALVILLSFISCKNQGDSDAILFDKSISVISSDKYWMIYSAANDSLKMFELNGNRVYEFLQSGKWYLDSLICINREANRLITAILVTSSKFKDAIADNIEYLLGEKINDNWYFFKGPSIVIPREMVKDHNIHTPLSYRQLHEIALKEVYRGYLQPNGDINDNWFLGQFEGVGWGDFSNQAASDYFIKGKRFTDKRKFFECIRLECVRNNWRNRDTSQAVIKLQQHGRP